MKLMRCTRVPPSIHSLPVCQRSTEGGFKSSCPICFISSNMGSKPGLGDVQSPIRRIVQIPASTELLILAKRAFLKASELNSTRSIERMLYPDRKYSSSSILMVSGSWGGVSIQDGT